MEQACAMFVRDMIALTISSAFCSDPPASFITPTFCFGESLYDHYLSNRLKFLVCCPLLSQTTLPRRAPSSTAFQQCSILRRVSSNCPVDGFVFCDAAPETNVFCFNGQWWVRTAAAANTNVTINTFFLRIPISVSVQRTAVLNRKKKDQLFRYDDN
ncbi:hypothetical protein ANCCEY_10805 [Ancylostoma ceylanicum]|uniref:Uncharacterized protein n=1 Tax=Ancylostoma ceylanicum TaxID=53326 RepID=A0A0D6LDE1_9BILA|nr:hypothetical protein ANCCEY_10805 [Ancylostoma ceylanicum]